MIVNDYQVCSKCKSKIDLKKGGVHIVYCESGMKISVVCASCVIRTISEAAQPDNDSRY